MELSLCICVLMLTSGVWGQQEERVLTPLTGKQGPDVGLVIVPGALLEYSQYRTIALELQGLSPLRLWCYLADGVLRDVTAVLAEEDTALGQGKAALVSAGMPQEAPLFGAGHSLGGVLLQAEVEEYPSLARGLALWGIVPLSPPQALPIPTLTLQGDLDGLIRITTVASQFYLTQQLVEGGQAEYKTQSVYRILMGVNHGQYATGELPEFVTEYDLPSELSDNLARFSINEVMDAFLSYHVLGEEGSGILAKKSLEAFYDQTSQYLTPLIEVFGEEESGESSPWVARSQRLLANLTQEQEANFQSFNEVVGDLVFPFIDPEIDLQNEKITAWSYAKVTRPEFGIPGPAVAADMLEAKMNSGLLIRELIDLISQKRAPEVTCKDLNQAAWDFALEKMPAFNRARWASTEIIVEFLEDDEYFWGPGWLDSELNVLFFAGVLSIQSSSLVVEIDPLEDYIHYCKLLSPARAMEYMYTDGLRDSFWIP